MTLRRVVCHSLRWITWATLLSVLLTWEPPWGRPCTWRSPTRQLCRTSRTSATNCRSKPEVRWHKKKERVTHCIFQNTQRKKLMYNLCKTHPKSSIIIGGSIIITRHNIEVWYYKLPVLLKVFTVNIQSQLEEFTTCPTSADWVWAKSRPLRRWQRESASFCWSRRAWKRSKLQEIQSLFAPFMLEQAMT